jgi:hypothetical protein
MKELIKVIAVALTLAAGTFAATGCDKSGGEEGASEEHAVVESGTYEGTIKEVNAPEQEIYVESDGKVLELYFTEETTLTHNGEAAEFSALEKDQRVEVEIEKVGQRLDPISVTILE